MSQNNLIVSCHDCGLLQKISHMPEDGAAICCRCGAVLRKRQRISPAKSIEHTLALVITAIILFIVANVYPIMQVEAEGHHMQATLLSCVVYLLTHDMIILGSLVFLTTIGAPLIQLTGLLYILFPVYFGQTPPFAAHVYRIVHVISSWSMLEVLMLGILVAVVKLSGMATVIPGLALWACALLIFFMAAILSDLDIDVIWEQISSQTGYQKINDLIYFWLKNV